MVLLNKTTYSATNAAFNLKVPQLDLHPCFKEFETYMRDVNKSPSYLFVSTTDADSKTPAEKTDVNMDMEVDSPK